MAKNKKPSSKQPRKTHKKTKTTPRHTGVTGIMPTGLLIPEKIKNVVKNNKFLLKLALMLYKPYFRFYINYYCWSNFNRQNSADIKPFRLLYINPDDIEDYIVDGHRNYEEDYLKPRIKDGDWDLQKKDFESKDIFKSIKMRFKENKSWTNTPKYKNSINAIENNEENYYKYGAETEKELLDSLKQIDELHNNILKEGYKTQNEARKGIKTDRNFRIDEHLPHIREILVSIGRDGDFILEDGNHRLAIAKLLELEKIPVRVLIRHREWQKIRNQAVNNPEKLTKKQKQHPDIKYLVE